MNHSWVPWDDPAELRSGVQTRAGRLRVRVYQDMSSKDTDVKHILVFAPSGSVMAQAAVTDDWDTAKDIALKVGERLRDR